VFDYGLNQAMYFSEGNVWIVLVPSEEEALLVF
jgi:hypothetical protein